MKAKTLLLATLIGFSAVSCAESDDGTSPELQPDPPANLDPTVAPVTQGDWYRPARDVTWQWQLTGNINTSYQVALYDLDLFETPAALITLLHARGARVMCYFSAGSAERVRPDYAAFPAAAIGKTLDGYPNERWLDIRSKAVFDAMLARLDLARQRGCDAVEPDNVTGYLNDTGFAISATHQLAFNRHLANAAHQRGLGIALKNDGEQASQLVDYFDLELNEECHDYDECEDLQPFSDHAKPVLNAEYASSAAAAQQKAGSVCARARSRGLRTLILPQDLDDRFRVSCF
jgi:hypothetical protein